MKCKFVLTHTISFLKFVVYAFQQSSVPINTDNGEKSAGSNESLNSRHSTLHVPTSNAPQSNLFSIINMREDIVLPSNNIVIDIDSVEDLQGNEYLWNTR